MGREAKLPKAEIQKLKESHPDMRISPRHGVNGSVLICPLLFIPTQNVVLHGRLIGDKKADKYMLDTEVCDLAQSAMSEGFLISEGPTPTTRSGRYWVTDHEAAARVFEDKPHVLEAGAVVASEQEAFLLGLVTRPVTKLYFNDPETEETTLLRTLYTPQTEGALESLRRQEHYRHPSHTPLGVLDNYSTTVEHYHVLEYPEVPKKINVAFRFTPPSEEKVFKTNEFQTRHIS